MHVRVIRKEIKNAYIQVVDEKTVEVRVPKNYSDYMISNILNEKKLWIQKKQLIIQNEKKKHRSFFEKKMMYYLGSSYSLDSLNQSSLDFSSDDWCEWYDYLLYDHAPHVFRERLHYLCRKLSLPEPKLKLRKMHKRWGTCYPHKQQIVLNRKMIWMPLEALDLVIVHELVHFEFPHHQKPFYQRLEEYMPDYQKRELLLKKYRHILGDDFCD